MSEIGWRRALARGLRIVTDNGDGTGALNVDATIDVGDIEIGAVEIKDGDSDTRLDVESDGTKNAAWTQSHAIGATADAAVDTDTTGSVSGKLRGLVKLMVNLLSRWPAALGAGGGLKIDGSGTALPVSLSSDIEIGAVELKNGTDDTRATVTAGNALKVDGSAATQPVNVAAQTAGTATHTADVTVDATAGGVTLLASNASRKAALIENTGSANMRVSIGGTPAAATGIQLAPGQSLRITSPFCPTATIKAIREGSSSTAAAVVEVA